MTTAKSHRWPWIGPRNAGLACALVAASACSSRTAVIQEGYRGNGKETNYKEAALEQSLLDNRVPPSLQPAKFGPVPVKEGTFKNVQVLTDISQPEFNRTMLAITQWVAPKTGPRAQCAYCHVKGNFPSDSIYAKVIARRMFQMVRHINHDWQPHVSATGVTCYTCHRGQAQPNGLWWYTDENQYLRAFLDRTDLRVQSHSVGPTDDNRSSIKQANWTYAAMIQMSRGLGVNCNYCHQTRSFQSWEMGGPKRVIAMYGLWMVRDLNMHYESPLKYIFDRNTMPLSPSRLGPLGDGPKLQCITCHNGVYKPLYGVSMAKDYPALWGQSTWDSTSVDLHSRVYRMTAGNGPATPDSTPGYSGEGVKVPATGVVPMPLPAPSGSAPSASSGATPTAGPPASATLPTGSQR